MCAGGPQLSVLPPQPPDLRGLLAGYPRPLPGINLRLELANAIFDYLEIFHNRQRRHSALGMLSPIQYELQTQSVS